MPAAFAAPGRPAWASDAEWVLGPSHALLGLAAGGWGWRDPFGSGAFVAPGVPESAPPSAWADSVQSRFGGMGATEGFGAPLARVEAVVGRPASKRARAVFTLLNGSSAIDRNSLLLARGDERSWFRGGSHGARRGALGSMDLSGEHLWFASGGTVRGEHETWARYTQAGYGNEQHLGGLREGGRAESGEAGWRWRRADRTFAVRASRAQDGRESRGNGVAFAESRRDAATDELLLEAGDSLGVGLLSARLSLGRERVVRVTPSGARPVETWRAGRGWLSVTLERPLAGGALRASLGGGRHDAPRRAEERWQMAPSLEWQRAAHAWSGRLFVDRTLTPVWSDLAPSVDAFMQDVWLAGAEGSVGRRTRTWLEVGGSVGRVGQRATILRYPVRDVALRLGWERDEGAHALAIASVAAGANAGPLALDARAFATTRSEEQSQPRVDPGVGGSAGVEGAIGLFSGDLAVRVRGQVAVVGAREVEYSAYDGVEPRELPGYATFGASLRATLGDATLGLRVSNLEDRRRPQVWIDPVTGQPALDAGRQLVFEILWPLFD